MENRIGHVSWNELITNSDKDSSAFYEGLFGWSLTPFSNEKNNTYSLFKLDTNEMGIAGMLKSPNPQAPSQWIPYVIVSSTDEALDKALKLGAKVLVPATSMPNVGRIAVIQDPQGANIGLHQLG